MACEAVKRLRDVVNQIRQVPHHEAERYTIDLVKGRRFQGRVAVVEHSDVATLVALADQIFEEVDPSLPAIFQK